MAVWWVQMITLTTAVITRCLACEDMIGIQRGQHLPGCYLWDSRPESACDLMKQSIPLWQDQRGKWDIAAAKEKWVAISYLTVFFGSFVLHTVTKWECSETSRNCDTQTKGFNKPIPFADAWLLLSCWWWLGFFVVVRLICITVFHFQFTVWRQPLQLLGEWEIEAHRSVF